MLHLADGKYSPNSIHFTYCDSTHQCTQHHKNSTLSKLENTFHICIVFVGLSGGLVGSVVALSKKDLGSSPMEFGCFPFTTLASSHSLKNMIVWLIGFSKLALGMSVCLSRLSLCWIGNLSRVYPTSHSVTSSTSFPQPLNSGWMYWIRYNCSSNLITLSGTFSKSNKI